MLTQLLGLLDARPMLAGHILIVDDESPDGTQNHVRKMASTDDRVLMLSGAKQGLGSAYRRGFEYVLAHLDVDAVVQMDADFSHAPEDAFKLIEELCQADVVIGSRYVESGAIDDTWGLWRKLLSWGGNLFARYVAGLLDVRDCTAGFRAIRVSQLKLAWPLHRHIQGYVFQVALLHSLVMSGARVHEYPIYFTERRAGQTKLGLSDIWEFFVHVWWLRLLSRKTFIKFMLVGGSGVVVNLGSFAAYQALGLGTYLSSAAAIETSIVWNFFLNNYWTFADRHLSSRKRVRGLKFNIVSLVTLLVSFSAFVALRWWFPEHPALLAQALSIIPAAMANYFANSYWTFKAE